MECRFFNVWILIAFFSLNSCNQSPTKKETPVSGSLTILADESFKPLLDSEVSVFEALYKNTDITVKYTPELKGIQALLTDTAELIIAGRRLTPKEKAVVDTTIIIEQHLATDALAFLTNKNLNDSLTSIETLKSIFSGKLKTWKEVNQNWPNEEIILVFDQSNSANLQMAKNQFGLETQKVKIFAAGSNKEVAEYVKKTPAALGIIGAGWISDEESTEAKKIRDGLNVVHLKNEKGEAFGPYQSSVYFQDNPFARKIYIIRRNKNMGLATGFTSFLLSQRGQRIVLKSGILPAEMPGREINIQKEQ